MTKITKEEILKIANMSHLDIKEEEIAPMMKQLEGVLTYAERVSQIAAETEEAVVKNTNVFREDVALHSDSERILERAPEREESFYVVPAIIEDK